MIMMMMMMMPMKFTEMIRWSSGSEVPSISEKRTERKCCAKAQLTLPSHIMERGSDPTDLYILSKILFPPW